MFEYNRLGKELASREGLDEEDLRRRCSEIGTHLKSRSARFVFGDESRLTHASGTLFECEGHRYVLTAKHCFPKKTDAFRFITSEGVTFRHNPVISVSSSSDLVDGDGIALLKLHPDAQLPEKLFVPLSTCDPMVDRPALLTGYPASHFEENGAPSTTEFVVQGTLVLTLEQTPNYIDPVLHHDVEFSLEYNEGDIVDGFRNERWEYPKLKRIDGMSGGGVWQHDGEEFRLIGVTFRQGPTTVRAFRANLIPLPGHEGQ